jgi:four helix bundle protein
MFLALNHQKLDIYVISRSLVFETYKLSMQLPMDEKFGMVTQIRRAALSIHLNIAEGASRKSSNERKRYYEIARGSVIEIDAALDVAYDLGYISVIDISNLGDLIIRCFKILTGLISACRNIDYPV